MLETPPGCARAARPCLRRPGPRPDGGLPLACKCWGRRSMMLRPLWTWQPWMAPCFGSLCCAFADDDSDRAPWRGDCRSRPGRRPFLRRPLDHGQDMLVAVAIDADAAIRTWSPTTAIWMTSRSSSERWRARLFLRDSATKRRETADFEVPSPRAFARSPSGRRTARWCGSARSGPSG